MRSGIIREKTKQRHFQTDAGTTLVEMIMCFALLSIFISAAASIIASTTNVYYQVKGETYSRQVADILMEKISSEIEGAKYTEDATAGNPVIVANNANAATDGYSSYVDLYDRTDTHVKIYAQNKMLQIYYYPFRNNEAERNGTFWRFDSKVYNGFMIEELKFIPGNETGTYSETLQGYGISNVSYDDSIVIILLKLKSDKYGEYKSYRPVKMFNVPGDTTSSLDP